MKRDASQPGRSPFSHQGNETHLFREILRAYQALVNAFTQEVGAPASRLMLARVLAIAHPEGAGVMEISRRLGVDAAAVTRQVQEMEAEGLVIRNKDPRDARRSVVKLSPKGLRLARRFHERMHEYEKGLESRLGPDEMGTAVRVLTQLRGLLDERRSR